MLSLIALLEKSRISAEDYPPENKMNEKQKKIMAEMQKFIAKISKSLNIAPEIIATKKEINPNKIFDTQIAAGLVGFEPQISYANLVEKLCGRVLKKSQTRANWEKRPLSKEMISYAREDVEFLLEMHAILLEKLKKMDRISWAEEDSKSLNNYNLYKFDPNEAINRIKSAKYLSGRTKKAIHLLLKWREEKAIEKNLPRQWIHGDP